MAIWNATDNVYFATVSEAMLASSAGDTLLLSSGLYVEEFPLITHSLTIQGVGGMAHLTTPNPQPANVRAVLFVQGNAGADLTVRNVEISGAANIYTNGAGILFESGNGDLRVEDSYFHGNQNGILVGSGAGMDVAITRSEFSANGLAPDVPVVGLPHNLYVNGVDTLTVTDSYFNSVNTAHELKSRALATTITHSRFDDGAGSQASYSIDMPNGGVALIQGNQIGKGPDSVNRHAIHYGGELVPVYPGSMLQVIDNVMTNLRTAGGTGIYNQSQATAGGVAVPTDITGNTLYGFDTLVQTAYGPASGTESGNTMLPGPGPAISTAHPWRILDAEIPAAGVAEPASALMLAGVLVAGWMARRRHAAP